jgi:hypothetical protein
VAASEDSLVEDGSVAFEGVVVDVAGIPEVSVAASVVAVTGIDAVLAEADVTTEAMVEVVSFVFSMMVVVGGVSKVEGGAPMASSSESFIS